MLAVALAVVAGGAWYVYEQSKVCCAFPDEPEPVAALLEDRPKLGLMTSLPLYWPLGLGIDQITSGQSEVPWQRKVLERRYELVPLDTLSSIPGLTPEEPETDPLEDIDYIAVIQPRGLSPADNVALDDWVRAGGKLLLVLDPMLTGEYDLPLGDPARPVDSALIPPVVKRWGLEVSFDPEYSADNGIRTAEFEDSTLFVMHGGSISISDLDAAQCELLADAFIARCKVDEGSVTLVADAAAFEHEGLEPLNLLDKAFR